MNCRAGFPITSRTALKVRHSVALALSDRFTENVPLCRTFSAVAMVVIFPARRSFGSVVPARFGLGYSVKAFQAILRVKATNRIQHKGSCFNGFSEWSEGNGLNIQHKGSCFNGFSEWSEGNGLKGRHRIAQSERAP